MTDKEIIKDFEEYTRNMRQNCVIKEGVVQVSKELWHQISNIIDAMGADNKRLYQNLNEAHIDIKEKQAEIEDLKKVVIDDYATEYDNKIKAEAVKEFAERLKNKKARYNADYFYVIDYIPLKEIDNLVKEMVGEG